MQQDRNITKRNIIAGAGVLIQLCLGTVYAWSIFKKPLMTGCGWSEFQTQSVYMTYSISFSLAVALGGGLSDRIGPRLVGQAGGLLFGLGILTGGVAIQYRLFLPLLIAYGGLAAAGAGSVYVTLLATLLRWFPDKRGLVTGLAIMGYGFGSFLLGTMGPASIINLGAAATFYIWGVAALMILLSAVQVVVNPPPNWSPVVPSSASVASLPESVALKEALYDSRFWILWAIFLIGTTVGTGLISQLSPLMQDVMGADPSRSHASDAAIAAGTVVAIAGVFNGCGRLAWSWLSDHIGRKTAFVLIFGSLVAGLLALPWLTSFSLFAIVCWLLLACYGGLMATMPALAADEFGLRYIGRVYGFIFLAIGPGSVCGTYLFAAIKKATGGFTAALYAEAGIALMGIVLVMILIRLHALKKTGSLSA